MLSRHYGQSVSQSVPPLLAAERAYLVLIMTAAVLVLVAGRALAVVTSLGVDTVAHTTGRLAEGGALGRDSVVTGGQISLTKPHSRPGRLPPPPDSRGGSGSCSRPPCWCSYRSRRGSQSDTETDLE